MTKTSDDLARNDDAFGGRAPRMIPLDRLSLSALNPRQEVTEAEIAAMADSIRTLGLLQNLAGLEDADGRVAITAGGRRLRALHLIADQDSADKSAVLAPVVTTTDPVEAEAWASAENTARSNPHPADEVRAYGQMAERHIPPETIAKAFAVTVRHVKGRLRLAGLAPAILDALRGDEITLDVAAAYTVSDDQTAQSALFERLSGAWHGNNPETIRRALTGRCSTGESRVARFVGRDAYEEAGGAVREDLFGEEVYFLDGELLTRLADANLEAIRAEHLAAGWKWVEITQDYPEWRMMETLGRTYPETVEPEEGEAERYDELADLVEAEAASDEERAEFDVLQEKLDRQDYSEEQRTHSGAVIWLTGEGGTSAEYGLIRPEDKAAAIEAGIMAAPHRSVGGSAEKKGPYSARLMDDLAKLRTGALQAALLDDPDLALDLLTFALSTPVYSNSLPVDIKGKDAENAPEDDEGLTLPKAIRAERYAAPLDGAEAAEAFTAFRRKKPATKSRMLTEAVAKTARIGLAGEGANPFAEMIARLAGAEARRVWTPTEGFFKRLSKDQLLEIHREVMGLQAPSATLAKQNKGSVANWLHAIFNGGNHAPTLNDDQKGRVAAWTPEGLAPAAATEDASASDEDAALAA